MLETDHSCFMADPIEHLARGDVVEIPREEFERLRATLEFLEDEELKRGVLRGLKEHQAGKSRSWDAVRDDL